MLEVGLYAGVLALIYIYLAVCVIRVRFKTQTKLGDGGHDTLAAAIRAHGNFSEYVPLALLMIGFLNYQGVAVWAIHALGITLIAGRVVHAYSIHRDILKLRPVGMGMTFTVIAVAALWLIFLFITK
jgi:uncharacterized membrane protein YecN with MAPEG domain